MLAAWSERTGSATMFRNTQGGVTLLELMTVIVIVSILAAVAIPSYRSYVIRAQRSDAKTALLNVRAAQEKFYLQNNRYTDEVTAPSGASPPGLGLRGTSDNGFYQIEVALTTDAGQGYTATATAIEDRAQKSDSKCTALSLTDVGLRGSTGPGGTDYCWR
jgi:type IV pilus assembly protein PilE